jgi:hypothetical protein
MLTFYLILYIVGIVWCKKAFLSAISQSVWESASLSIINRQAFINTISWIPVLNLLCAFWMSIHAINIFQAKIKIRRRLRILIKRLIKRAKNRSLSNIETEVLRLTIQQAESYLTGNKERELLAKLKALVDD